MFNTITFIRIDDIIEDVRRMMATIGVFSFDEILSVDEDVLPRRTIRTIISRSNATFSRHFPLYYVQILPLNNQNQFTFVDNFDLYLAGTLDPKYITLIPDAVVSISTMPYPHAKYNYIRFHYQPPTLFLKGTYTQRLFAKTLCKYRLHFDNNNVSNDAIYFMEKNTSIYDIFLKQVVYDFAFFIIMMKNNYQISALPIEVFNGLEELVGELRNELETLYQENPRNYLIMW